MLGTPNIGFFAVLLLFYFRKRKTVQNGQITTDFFYNAVNELVKVRNTEGYDTKYEYDLAGRRTKEMHPDRGMTTYKYNKIGNVVEKQTANLMQGTAGIIKYTYDYHRLTKITYPEREENNVEYVYGTTAGDGMGKVVLQKDATGIQWFSYGKLGELTFAGRAVAVAGRTSYWFTTSWEYDSWNRIHKITYPDDEIVTYQYDPAGQLRAIETNLLPTYPAPNIPLAVNIVTNITYNQYGERQRIDYGNGTWMNYTYDALRRLKKLQHQFSPTASYTVEKEYTYDKLSNVTDIATQSNGSLLPFTETGVLAGPTLHHYEYDNYNRLIKADGWYIGPNDRTPLLLKQVYDLNMTYDDSHNITQKKQDHQQGRVTTLGGSMSNVETMENTAYNLDYEDYASGNFTTESYSYVQPHAPRTIVQYPENLSSPPAPGDPAYVLVKKQLLDYDANGNLLSVQQEISDPDDPLGNKKIMLRENIWDEENRLRAVDLMPEAPSNKAEIAAYTYDASGQRIVKYLPGRLDAYYSATAAGSKARMEAIIYPSPLLTVKTLPLPEGINPDVLERKSITKYTKHYYIGTERISSTIGTMDNLGLLCEWNFPGDTELVTQMDDKVLQAQDVLLSDVDTFEKKIQLLEPFLYEGSYLPYCRGKNHDANRYSAYWYHPDHLGSSNYITNLDGNINQHMEYLPFGETLVEEHLNSHNSPYKFNAKEFDAETGWYYYGARYYNPKWSIWLSVDPLAGKFPSWSPYVFTMNNPINMVDVDGLYPIYIVTRSYAPHKTFGPNNAWHGDNRGHSLSRAASYRTLASINYDTETYQSSVFGGRSTSRTVDGSRRAESRTYVENRSDGNNLDVHSYGNNAAQPGSWDIDQFTKLEVTTTGDIEKNHILNIKGTISGDDFPNQESFIYDSEGNSLWLGNYETSGDRQSAPVTDLIFENEGDVNINVDIQINVNSDGVFQSVRQGDETISIKDWNAQFEQK